MSSPHMMTPTEDRRIREGLIHPIADWYAEVVEYDVRLGIPPHQLDFSPNHREVGKIVRAQSY